MLLLLALACSAPITSVATQNTGTTPWLSLVSDQPDEEVRASCEEHYDNNLCLSTTEEHLASALAADLPDVVFLQEVWDSGRCQSSELTEAPYACSQEGPQLDRVLPEGWSWGCAQGYPDTCLAWSEAVFQAQGEVEDLVADCGPPGRVAMVQGRGALLVSVHLNAGATDDDALCRVAQLGALEERLLAEPADTDLLVGGDFNFDPSLSNQADVAAFDSLINSVGLEALPVDDSTHRISLIQLDHLLARGLELQGGCEVGFADEGTGQTMLDHALVRCH